MTGAVNGTPGAANPLLDALDRDRRVRQLVGQIADRQPLFRGVLRTLRRDLGELCELTGTDGNNVFVHMDGLDRDIKSLLYWASGGEHDAHEPAANQTTSLP